MKGKTVVKILGLIGLGLCAAVGLGLLLGFGVMWLWNWLMPSLFGVPEIGYWQAVGLFILCHLLFKNHSAHHTSSGKDKGKHSNGFFKAHIQGKLRKKEEEAGPETATEPA
ncbi:MAG: hypothetical protein ACYS47_13410 [Planctomycetota bacterium]|jgi:hypothetical protein